MSNHQSYFFDQNNVSHHWFNLLPNHKILNWWKLKAFSDDKINVNEKMEFDLGRLENIMGKGENAGYQVTSIFSFSHNVFHASQNKFLIFQPHLFCRL